MSYFFAPKGGWPTDVMVPSERVAAVTKRLNVEVNPIQDALEEISKFWWHQVMWHMQADRMMMGLNHFSGSPMRNPIQYGKVAK